MENVRIPWDDWKVVKRIGKGSYGTVYEIERTLGSRTEKSAMKVISIPPDQSAIDAAYVEGYEENSIVKMCSDQLEQILDEYMTMKELSGNSNIVTCEDVKYVPHDNALGWDVYIRMELLTPLMTMLKTKAMELDDIYKLGMDICQALVLCEEKDIIHRDVKPENIFVSDNGTYKLGDFGIARTLDHTTHATRAGTERYMAPEVFYKQKYGRNADTYSLGLIMYWLLNNRRMPFLDPNKVPTADEQSEAQSRRLRGEAFPEPVNGTKKLHEIILKACAYDREARYESAVDMLLDLKQESENAKKSSAPEENKTPELEPKESESIVSAPKMEPSKNIYVDEDTKTNSWEEEKTVGRDFLDDNKESEFDEAEQKTLTPEWEEEKKNKEQKNQKDVKNYKNKTSHNTEIDNSSSKNEPVPVSETIPNTTKSKRFPPLLLFLIGGLIVLGAVVFAAIYSDSNNSSSSSSHLSSGSSTTIGGRTFETVTLGGIEWIVLAEEGNDTLLLSKDILEYKPYNEEYESVTWETCTLRSYLNGTWYEDTFGEEEKGKILTTNVVNSDNAVYGTPGGNDTKDKVFLLSMDEVERYFSSDDEKVAKYNGEADYWWLRSPGISGKYAADVYSSGYVDNYGSSVNYDFYGIRPALWVNLNS